MENALAAGMHMRHSFSSDPAGKKQSRVRIGSSFDRCKQHISVCCDRTFGKDPGEGSAGLIFDVAIPGSVSGGTNHQHLTGGDKCLRVGVATDPARVVIEKLFSEIHSPLLTERTP